MDVATICGGADSPLTAVAYSWRIPHLTGYRVAAGGREMSVAVNGAAASSMKTATTCRRTACSRSAPARIMPAIAHGGHGGDGPSSSSAARDLADERAGVAVQRGTEVRSCAGSSASGAQESMRPGAHPRYAGPWIACPHCLWTA